jgi:UDPglucose--hexose-1-phosphate uridylyltransferase
VSERNDDENEDAEGELRLDPLTLEWVTIVRHRQDRPNLPSGACPFCPGGLEAPQPYDVKAFPNRWPAMVPGPAVELGAGVVRAPARGAAEVVLYTPDHHATFASLGVEHARRVVDLWAERTEALLARDEIEYVLVFENRGIEVGATIDHPHGQIYAFPFLPPVPRREADVADAFGCPLCRVVPAEADDGARAVHDGGEWLAWVPFASGYPFGLLVAPRAHVGTLPELDGRARDGLAAALVDVLARYDRLFDRPFPYMLWIHPGVHLHIHLTPPLRSRDVPRFVAGAELGSGTLGNPVAPEDAAAALRDA